jgi:pyoverdine/dityrosine biosynthesis protein Dit1
LPFSSTMKMEAIHSSETSVNIYVTTRRYILEDNMFHSHRLEKLKTRHNINEIAAKIVVKFSL